MPPEKLKPKYIEQIMTNKTIDSLTTKNNYRDARIIQYRRLPKIQIQGIHPALSIYLK